MANYYTEFSFALPKVGEEKEEAWAAKMIKGQEEGVESSASDDWYDSYGGVVIERSPWVDAVWLREESEGNVEAAVWLTQKYLKEFDIEGGVYFSWASYCSSPRINEATGGSVVVTKDDAIYLNSHDILKQAGEAGIEVLNK